MRLEPSGSQIEAIRSKEEKAKINLRQILYKILFKKL